MEQRRRGEGSEGNAGVRRKNNRKRARMRRRRFRIFIGLVLSCAILILGAFYMVVSRYVAKYPADRICDHIYIGSYKVSGLTKAEAQKSMNDRLAADRTVTVRLTVGSGEAEATLEQLGLTCKDMKKTIDTAYDYGKKGSLWERYRALKKLSKEKLVLKEEYVLDQKTAKAFFEEQVVPLAKHAQSASMKRENGKFLITKEKQGKTVDIEKSCKKIEKKLNNGWDGKGFSVEMTQKKEKPAVTEKQLETVGDKLGSYSTDAGGGERWKNLKTGVGKLDGTVLAPGETISVYEATSPYDEENGYVAAGSYENGQVVDTYGGGICQVSTTLYNAVLYAELEVVERHPHSMLVAYIDPSRDAAIAEGVKDFKFKNSYDTPVYIEGYIDDDNQLTFTIYGKDTREKGRTVEYESETTSTEEYGRIYQEDSEAPLGSFEYEGNPHTGKEARLWKIVKKKGKEVSRDVINESTYQKSDEIIVVGTNSENGTASGIVSGAIDTQDGEKINAAIDKARGLE